MKTSSFSTRSTRLTVIFVVISLGLASLETRANDRAWEVLTNFPPNAGPNDNSPLVEGAGGYFGTTSRGGSNGYGDLFEITSAGVCTEIYSFTNGNDGNGPLGGLTPGGDGYFYGVTLFGGTNGGGTVFKITPAGALTPLYSFPGGDFGNFPNAGLVKGPGGLFYGTTYFGGSNGFGGVFSVTSGGQLTELYSFTNGVDGLNVSTVLTVSGGNLYGTSQYGGSTNNAGTIFKITPAGAFTVLYVFTNGVDGALPAGGLAMDGLGNFYGVASQGGTNGNGLAFQMTPSGSLTVLYSFTGGLDGSTPGAPLTAGNDGNFYGTTLYAGEFFGGTAFQMTPAGTLTTLLRFNQPFSGGAPGALIQGSDLNFYGLTIYGGAYADGTIFKFSSSVSQPGLQDQIPASEYSALTDLYNFTGGSDWNQSYGWLDPAADYWYGLTVSPRYYDASWNLVANSDVSDLNLSYNNLVGTIPDSIGNLPLLAQFLLNNNGLSGTIPDSFAGLTNLNSASLSGNSLTGGLPAGIGSLTQLTNFTVNFNQLTDGIPPALGNLSLLQNLDLSDNQFGGTIPDSMGNLTNLQNLNLAANGLTGGLPDALTNLTFLRTLTVNGNLLTGPVPDGIGALSQLTYLDLASNAFSGSIPDGIGSLTQLTNLDLDNNQLSGSIPDDFGGQTNLLSVYLNVNDLTGDFPESLSTCTNLQTVLLFSNYLSGNLPALSAGYIDVTWNDLNFDTDSTNYNVAQEMIANGQTVIYLPQNIPTILNEPSGLSISGGHPAVFSATIENGSTFQWLFNGQPLTNGSLVANMQTISLRLPAAQSSNAGSYDVIVSNSYGAVTSATATLSILGEPVSFNTHSLLYSSGYFNLQINGLTGQGQVVIDASTNLIQWTPIFTNPSGFGAISFTDSNAASFPYRFYRATVPPQ
jgi:uncharacterized repeat protein (TIGR03803 family)